MMCLLWMRRQLLLRESCARPRRRNHHGSCRALNHKNGYLGAVEASGHFCFPRRANSLSQAERWPSWHSVKPRPADRAPEKTLKIEFLLSVYLSKWVPWWRTRHMIRSAADLSSKRIGRAMHTWRTLWGRSIWHESKYICCAVGRSNFRSEKYRVVTLY